MAKTLVNVGTVAILDDEDHGAFIVCIRLFQHGVVPKEWPDALFRAYAEKYGFEKIQGDCIILESGAVVQTMAVQGPGGVDN